VTRLQQSQRFIALDSMRGCCALLVAAYHLNPQGRSLLGPLLANSYLWVDFFFVLSGFVIAHGYEGRIVGLASARSFLVRRLARVYPLHLFVLALYVALELSRLVVGGSHAAAGDHPPFSGWTSLGGLAANLFLVHGLGLTDYLTWNAPSWSISCEFWTYALFALLALLVPMRSLLGCGLLAAGALAAIALSRPEDMNLVSGILPLLRCIAGFFLGVAAHPIVRGAPPDSHQLHGVIPPKTLDVVC